MSARVPSFQSTPEPPEISFSTFSSAFRFLPNGRCPTRTFPREPCRAARDAEPNTEWPRPILPSLSAGTYRAEGAWSKLATPAAPCALPRRTRLGERWSSRCPSPVRWLLPEPSLSDTHRPACQRLRRTRGRCGRSLPRRRSRQAASSCRYHWSRTCHPLRTGASSCQSVARPWCSLEALERGLLGRQARKSPRLQGTDVWLPFQV